MSDIGSAPWTSCEAQITAPARRADLSESELDGEGLLYDEATGQTHRLNQTALAVWRLCDGQRTTRDIAEVLTDAYEVEFDRALDHVEQILVRLAEAGLLNTTEALC